MAHANTDNAAARLVLSTRRQDYRGLYDYMKHNFGDLPEHRRIMLMNRAIELAKFWHIAGGGTDKGFERDFNNEQ